MEKNKKYIRVENKNKTKMGRSCVYEIKNGASVHKHIMSINKRTQTIIG